MQVDHFLDKNKDFVVKEHQDLLAGSSLPLVARAPRRLLLKHLSCKHPRMLLQCNRLGSSCNATVCDQSTEKALQYPRWVWVQPWS